MKYMRNPQKINRATILVPIGLYRFKKYAG